MPQLGDLLPDGARKNLASSTLVPGRVFCLYVDFTTPAKEKLVLLLTREAPFLFFVINTRVSPYVRMRPALFVCQMGLALAENSFLDHDSVLDCSTVRVITEVDVCQQLQSDFSRCKGEINQAAKQNIIALVKQATTITRKDKKRIIHGLT